MKNLPQMLTLLFIVAVAGWTLSQIRNPAEESEKTALEMEGNISKAVQQIRVYSPTQQNFIVTATVFKTENEWKKQLTRQQFVVTRKKATEIPYTGKYWDTHETGVYQCVGCGNDLFSSETKFDSGTGWPSFFAPLAQENIELISDLSLGIPRNEVRCSRCKAHLGHVFNDGPEPTGLRYCLNSAALNFIPASLR